MSAKRTLAFGATVLTVLLGLATPVAAHGHARSVYAASYAYGDDPNDTLTLYSPDALPHPTIVYVHGGGWRRATANADEVAVAKSIEARTGWNVAVVNYPTDVTPYRVTEPEAVRTAVRYVKALPNTSATTFLWGESAGGQLALLTAYRHTSLVDAVVSVSGPTDMVEAYATIPFLVGPYEGAPPASDDPRYANTSPGLLAAADTPPTFQAIGADDPLVPAQSIRELAGRLRDLGIHHRTYVLQGVSDHAYDLEPDVPTGEVDSVKHLAEDWLANLA